MKKRKGASTILVLFMVIVLITFGLFTIVSANINYRLSKKSASWSSIYYDVDKEGERNLATIDEILLVCEKEAVQNTLNFYGFTESDYSSTDIYDFLNNNYKTLAYEKLEEVASYNEEASVTMLRDEKDTLIYSTNVYSEEVENYKIEIELEVKDILYDINYVDGEIVGEKIFYEPRYDIVKWKQSQEIEVETIGIEIWDPRESIEVGN